MKSSNSFVKQMLCLNLIELKQSVSVVANAASRAAICEVSLMRVIAYDTFRPGVTMEQITPYLPEEVSNVWRLWKAGIVRENYARTDDLGVVIVFEVADVATARKYIEDFPLSKAGLLEWSFIGLQVPLPIEALFR